MDWKEKCVKQLGTCANDSLTGERRFSGGDVRVFQLQREADPQATRAGFMVLGIAQIKLGFVDSCSFISDCQIQSFAFACRALHTAICNLHPLTHNQ